MKLKKKLAYCFILCLCICPAVFAADLGLFDVSSLVRPSAVVAHLKSDAAFYAEPTKKSAIVMEGFKGMELEILRDRNTDWYYARDLFTAETGWVEGKYLTIPPDPPTNQEYMSQEELEAYMNSNPFSSQTRFFIWTDIDRQLTHIFTGKTGEWSLYQTMACATGVNESPTTRGEFTVGDRGQWFYTKRFQSGAKYWVRFNETYLFHSVSMDKDQNIVDPVLGQRRSNGCVRLSVENAKWIYEHIPDGTGVFIN